MAFICNGVTIPTNVANAIKFNGANVTDVVYNGVNIWHQSLFNAIWSGDSLSGTTGLSTSGTLIRAKSGNVYGPWITASTAGTFNGILSSSNSFRLQGYGNNTLAGGGASGLSNDRVYFTIGSGFSGSSTISATGGDDSQSGGGIQTAGGLLRAAYFPPFTTASYGAYISLT